MLKVGVIEDLRVVLEDFVYKDITVPKGFVFNGNSVPRFARPILGQYDYLECSCVHDFLYDKESDYLRLTRKYADKLYKNMLIEFGCSRLASKTYYIFLRLIGWRKFKKYSFSGKLQLYTEL